MIATKWEFKNRAAVFGLIFGCASMLYGVDRENAGAALANWLSSRIGVDSGLLVHLVFAMAAALVMAAALLRTWASSYLQADVVYAADLKTDSLVADGPYRRVRNPLYLANLLLGVGMGLMMSRTGLAVSALGMGLFCYRLILREEAELAASQGAAYEQYRHAVPRCGFL